MVFERFPLVFVLATFFLSVVSTFNFNRDEEHKDRLPFLSGNRPRISIFSKPPGRDAPKTTGLDIVGHAGNVIQGGSVGVELDMNPASGISGIIDTAKKIIPGGPTHPQVGRPEEQKPPSEPQEPPRGDYWEDKNEENWDNDKDESVPDYEKPEKHIPDGPSWDDIGEDPEDDSAIPYEEIIDPRIKPQTRPKRAFSNSKIYRIPLKFSSNAKPMGIRFMKFKEVQAEKNTNSLF